MPAGARLIHYVLTSSTQQEDAGGLHFQEATGFAILAVQPSEKYSNAYEIVRVWFRTTPGGRPEDGALEVVKVELAHWTDTKKPVDEDGAVIDDAIFLRALRRDLPAALRRASQHLDAITWHRFHMVSPPRVKDEAGKPTPPQPVLCGAPDVPTAWAFDTWDQVVAEASKSRGRIEPCYDCRAKVSK